MKPGDGSWCGVSGWLLFVLAGMTFAFTFPSAADDPLPASDSLFANEMHGLTDFAQVPAMLIPDDLPALPEVRFGKGPGPFPSPGLILYRDQIVPPARGTNLDKNTSGSNFAPYQFKKTSGTQVYKDLCSPLSQPAFFSPSQDASVLLDIDFRPGQLNCASRGSSASDFVDAVKPPFPDRKIYYWPIGRIGFILFTNRLIPEDSAGSRYGQDIASDRLAALLTFAISRNVGRQQAYTVDWIVVTPPITLCRCDLTIPKSKAHEILAAGLQQCVTRDALGRACPGTQSEWSGERRPRWYFNPSEINSDYLRPGPLNRESIETLRNDTDGMAVDTWCQLDPFFPCTSIQINVLTAEPSVTSELKAGFAQALAFGICPSCDYLSTQDRSINVISVAARATEGMVANANKQIDDFVTGPFGFLAIPVGLLNLGGLHLDKLLPLDIQEDNSHVVELIEMQRYTWIRSIEIVISTLAATNKNLSSYFRIVATKNGRDEFCPPESGCSNLFRIDFDNDIDWFVRN